MPSAKFSRSPAIPDLMLQNLELAVRRIYSSRASDVPFHGWGHVQFVRTKAVSFAPLAGADPSVAAAAALTHDLNYLVETNSDPVAGRETRIEMLSAAGILSEQALRIDKIVDEAHTATRGRSPSPEAMALSDADTLFKALPITPVALSCQYRAENGITLRQLAEKIVREQVPLFEQGIYFYISEVNDQYLDWAKANLYLWQQVLKCLDDPEAAALLQNIHA